VFIADIETAEELTAHDCFYTAMNLDWRGRVYGVPHFNFQRDDRVRALFLFADGEPIGAEGLNWLKVHIANCGDFDKISKRSFDERLWWVADNIEKIKANAEAPLELRWWTEADKPFQFLAACKELTAALKEGPAFVSRLPVSFDGSCSGLQHLSAMMRDEKTAPLVNLTAHKRPKDTDCEGVCGK
jgi:DNA-directed RNA polymerase